MPRSRGAEQSGTSKPFLPQLPTAPSQAQREDLAGDWQGRWGGRARAPAGLGLGLRDLPALAVGGSEHLPAPSTPFHLPELSPST